MISADSVHRSNQHEIARAAPQVPHEASRSAWHYWAPAALLTLAVGLALTVALALVVHSQYRDDEKRLLKLRVRDAGALLTQAMPAIQTPLASASALANATGDARRFIGFISPYVGPPPAKQFVSASLWDRSAPQRGPVALDGLWPKLSGSKRAAQALIVRAAHGSAVSVIGLLSSPDPRIGYAFRAPGFHGRFVAYAESRLPANRQSVLQRSSEFAGLDYAVFLGRSQQPSDLLVSSRRQLPLPGSPQAITVPFGDGQLTLAMSTRQSLSGSLPRRLPTIIAIVGVLLSLAGALSTGRMVRRRRGAEWRAERMEVTASENRRLYVEQQTIAQTLQHALLPESLPTISAAEASALYEAGERGLEVGGDWYDVIALDQRRLLLVVGDVSGRGLRAATTMASLRYSIRAYAKQGDSPAEIMTKLGELLDVVESGHIATVLFVQLDTEREEIAVTSAGHLPPLLLNDGRAEYVQAPVGVPIGVETGARYESKTIAAPVEGTIVAFTDGLVETRGEDLERGLERARAAASDRDASLPELLRRLVTGRPGGRSRDDVAIVGLRWRG